MASKKAIATLINKDISLLNGWLNKDIVPEAYSLGLNPKTHKGWFGLVVEDKLGVKPNSSREPDKIHYEIKTVALRRNSQTDKLSAKETLAVTMVADDTSKLSWDDSHAKSKINRVLIAGREWHSTANLCSELRLINDFCLSDHPDIEAILEADYEQARNKLKRGHKLSSADGQLMQARTKGAGNGSTSRAFYLRKPLVNLMFGLITEQELLDELDAKRSRAIARKRSRATA